MTSTTEGDNNLVPLEAYERGGENQESWEGCSLCSGTADDDDLDNDDLVPIPGRESHTSDIDQYLLHVAELKAQKRRPDVDLPFHEQFWDDLKGVLQNACPVGYTEMDSPTDVQHKGPDDNAAFMRKLENTKLINPIHPILLAKAFQIPLDQVLTELLFGAKLGFMNMKLTPNCQRCGSSVCAVDRVSDLPSEAYCEGCQYKNTIECLSKIKVVFVLNRDVFYVLAEGFACQPSQASLKATVAWALAPGTFRGSGFRYSFGCGGEKEFRPALRVGKYRMRCPIARTDNYLLVERDAIDEDEPIRFVLNVSDVVCRNPMDPRKTLVLKHGKVHFDIFTNTKSFFSLWILDNLGDSCLLDLPENERKPFTNAFELLNHVTYQFLFAEQTEENLTNALMRMEKVQSSDDPQPRKRLKPCTEGGL